MLKKLQLFEFAFLWYEYISYIYFSSANMFFTCFFVVFFLTLLYIEDSNPLLCLCYILWIMWYIYAILRLLTLCLCWNLVLSHMLLWSFYQFFKDRVKSYFLLKAFQDPWGEMKFLCFCTTNKFGFITL